jgi:hypothetical protein
MIILRRCGRSLLAKARAPPAAASGMVATRRNRMPAPSTAPHVSRNADVC